MPDVIFLPGAIGSAEFWRPVGSYLPTQWPQDFLSWPGLGSQPHDPHINSLDDLVQWLYTKIDRPVDLVAQSLGGLIAARLALAHPTMVRNLVLAVTSAGVDMAEFGASDWRPDYRNDFPHAAEWITQHQVSAELAVEHIQAPTLLIWGERDPISPVTVGQHLQTRLPNAKLHIVPDGDHDLALTHPKIVASLIAEHFLIGG